MLVLRIFNAIDRVIKIATIPFRLLDALGDEAVDRAIQHYDGTRHGR